MNNISPSAQISSKTKLGNNVTISPFVIIEGDVTIGDNTIIYPFVHIKGPVEIGSHNQIFNHVTIGSPPQDLSYKGSPNKIIIGNGNILREGVTVHAPALYEDSNISPNTVIGNDCLLMVNSHVSHNTVLKNSVIFANGVLPAGSCLFEDGVFISGGVLIHQFVRIGAHTIISGGSRVGRDVPPFSLVSSFYGLVSGINSIGLRRAGFTAEERKIAKNIFRIFKNHPALNSSIEEIKKEYHNDLENKIVKMTLEFLKDSKRGLTSFGEGKDSKNSMME